MSEQFVPIEGQCFRSHQDWVNRASRALTAHPEYFNAEHAETTGWRGYHFAAMCFDQKGRRVRNGGDFKRAEEERAFPVYWIWPDQIVTLITAAAKQAEPAQ
jgi:hypothetical protein